MSVRIKGKEIEIVDIDLIDKAKFVKTGEIAGDMKKLKYVIMSKFPKKNQ